ACLFGAGAAPGTVEEKPPARKDLHGDHLPPGARVRLGTVRFRHPGSDVVGLAFSKDGRTIVSADDSSLRVWDRATGRLVREARLGDVRLRGFALSPDGRLAAVAASGARDPKKWAVRLVNVGTGKVVRTLPREGFMDWCALAFTPDGKHLVSLA